MPTEWFDSTFGRRLPKYSRKYIVHSAFMVHSKRILLMGRTSEGYFLCEHSPIFLVLIEDRQYSCVSLWRWMLNAGN